MQKNERSLLCEFWLLLYEIKKQNSSKHKPNKCDNKSVRFIAPKRKV